MKTLNPTNRTPEQSKQEEFEVIKRRIHSKLVDKLDLNRVGELKGDTLRREIRLVVEHLCDSENTLLNRAERDRIVDEVMDETFGLGPLELLLKDATISDILINGPKNIFVERRGRLEKTEVEFRDNQHLMQIIDRIVSKVGRRVDETCPMVDARLEDGSRVNAIIPPLALDGAAVSIRRFGSNPLKLEDLLNYKAFTPEMVMLLEGCIKARLNMIICGGTGSGKTTLLNTLSSFIPNDQRIVTIEDAAELQLQQEHVVRLETRPANIEGNGAITATDLVKNALRMRPERIIIGECVGGNVGHASSHEHRPRWFADNDPLQQPTRRYRATRNLGHDGWFRNAGQSDSTANRWCGRCGDSSQPTARWTTSGYAHHGDCWHGARHGRDARHLSLQSRGNRRIR